MDGYIFLSSSFFNMQINIFFFFSQLKFISLEVTYSKRGVKKNYNDLCKNRDYIKLHNDNFSGYQLFVMRVLMTAALPATAPLRLHLDHRESL